MLWLSVPDNFQSQGHRKFLRSQHICQQLSVCWVREVAFSGFWPKNPFLSGPLCWLCSTIHCRFFVICVQSSYVLLGFKHPYLFRWNFYRKLFVRKLSSCTIFGHPTNCNFDPYLVSANNVQWNVCSHPTLIIINHVWLWSIPPNEKATENPRGMGEESWELKGSRDEFWTKTRSLRWVWILFSVWICDRCFG